MLLASSPNDDELSCFAAMLTVAEYDQCLKGNSAMMLTRLLHAACADLGVNGVNEHILCLQGFSHGFTNAFEGGQALLYIVQVQVLLPLGHLPVLCNWTQALSPDEALLCISTIAQFEAKRAAS